MSDITSYSQITTTDIDSSLSYLQTILKEEYPSMDLTTGGVLHALNLRPNAVLQAIIDKNLDRVRNSMSLQAISENPSLVDTEAVDYLLSNYNISRSSGTGADGFVVMVMDRNMPFTLSTNTTFTANGETFITDQIYYVVTSSDQVLNSSYKLLEQRADGSYQVSIPVSASTTGTSTNLSKDTSLSMSSSPAGFVSAYAESDFMGGRNADDISSLVTNAMNGVASRVFSNRTNIESIIKLVVPTTTHVSVVGTGDSEMVRDRHNLFNISSGGKVDVYVATQNFPTIYATSKTATLVDRSTGEWQFTFTKDQYPAFYRLTYIRPTSSSSGTYQTSTDSRSYDLTGDGFISSINSRTEGAYSAYQTASIRFIDTDKNHSSLNNGDTATYYIGVMKMNFIEDLQALFVDRDFRQPASDYLVRAPVPCIVGMTVKINKLTEDADIDTNAVKSSIASAVNNVGFGYGKLTFSTIAHAVQSSVSGKSTVDPDTFEFVARVYYPDGTTEVLRDDKVIELPNEPSKCTTARTTLFMTSKDFISLSVQEVDYLEV